MCSNSVYAYINVCITCSSIRRKSVHLYLYRRKRKSECVFERKQKRVYERVSVYACVPLMERERERMIERKSETVRKRKRERE